MTINIFNVKYTLKKEHILILCLFAVILISFLYFFDKSQEDELIYIEPQDTASIVQAVEEIKVYITGCIRNPGIYTVEKGILLYEVIDKAGGLTDEADEKGINMVFEVRGNMMITILDKDGFQITENMGYAVTIPGSSGNEGFRINVNTADISGLCTLPGIGETLASAIIDYRNQNGAFKNAAEIVNVPGIKGGKYEGIKDLITVN